ncbi:MAG TPA: TolC family protein [Stenomitos sp.]
MLTFRHFMAVGVGAAIALSFVEPGVSQELLLLQDLSHTLPEPGNPDLSEALTQEPLFTSVLIEKEETRKPEEVKESEVLPEVPSSSTPITLALQAERPKRVVNPVRKVNRGRATDRESQNSNQQRRSEPSSFQPVRGLDAATLTLTPEPQAGRVGNTQNRPRGISVSERSVTQKPALESAVPAAENTALAQSPRPNQRTPAPESLNPSPDPLLFPTQSQEVQITNAQAITLEQALELAQRNNRTIEAAKLTLERNQSALQEALAAEFPTLGVTATFSRDESAAQRLRNSASANNPFFNPTNIISQTFNGALQANYDLFTAGLRPAQIRQAEQQVRFQQLEVERLSEQLRLDVTNAYYAVQEADAQVNIFQDAVRAATQSLRDAQLLEQAGLGTRFDVLQAEVDLASSQQELTRALSEQRVSRRQIAQLLSVPQTADLSAADPIAVAGQWPLSLEQSIVLAYKNRAELEQFLVQRDIGEQQRRIALAAIRPQAGLSASYNVLGILSDDQGPAGGLSLGATLRWNFFDGGAAHSRAEQARRNISIAETRFADQRNQVRLEVEQSFFNLNANAQNIETATIALQRAEESLRLARLRFQAGVGTQTDVLNQQTALTRARFNQLSAILEYNRALATLQRATSNLPNSNLSNLP